MRQNDLSETSEESSRRLNTEQTTSQDENMETTFKRPDTENLRLNETMGQQVREISELNKATIHDVGVIGAGELVRGRRTDLDLNQNELADKLGYARQSISYWERNRIPIPLENLRQLSHMVGKDLEQGLRELQLSGNQNVAMEWKGAIYSVDAFMESIRHCCVRLNYSETSRLYYLELNPTTNVEFHRGDKMMTLLEKDGVQAIAELAITGVRALIKRTIVERMDIEPGDKLTIKILNVSSPEDPPWKESIPIALTVINGENRIQPSEKLQELGFKVREGDYLKMIIQTDKGEGLVHARIREGTVPLNKRIKRALLEKGGKESSYLTLKTRSVVLSKRQFKKEENLAIRVRGAVHVGGFLSREGFTLISPEERGILKATSITQRGSRERKSTCRLSMRIIGIDRDVYPPYSTTDGTKLKLRTDDIVVLKSGTSGASEHQDGRRSHDGTHNYAEKSIVGRNLFDAFTKHLNAETLYQVENPNQHGIDRIIERNGRIVLVEEKAEYGYGLEWRSTATVCQITGYKNRFRELVEGKTELRAKLQGREPDVLEIWTTAKMPRDQNGEIELSKIRLYDSQLKRTLREGETATFRVPQAEKDGKVQYCLCQDVPHKISVSENGVVFSLPKKSIKLNDGREVILLCKESSEWLEINVKHYDHMKSACENARLFDDRTRRDLKEKLDRIGRRC
jgi:transcriptional regulator with XRE-family HTH domain